MIEMMHQQGITSYRLGSETLFVTATEDGEKKRWCDKDSEYKFAPGHKVLFSQKFIGHRYTREDPTSFDFAQGVSFALGLPAQLDSRVEDPMLFMKEIEETIEIFF